MTEYWVSQGNKWCDFCKIFISNNPSTIRNHELGQRHKDNVALRLTNMRKENAAKDKEQKEAVRAIEQIEARREVAETLKNRVKCQIREVHLTGQNPASKAKRSYQKDIANFREARDSHALPVDIEENGEEKWELDSTSGYYYNESNGFYYDSNSGFYYSDAIGKWVTQEEAHASPQFFSNYKHKKPVLENPSSASSSAAMKDKSVDKGESGPPPGLVVSASLNPKRSVKGAASSIAVGKRKRPGEKQKPISEEEKAALKAREAAKKRVEQREKPLLGLYKLP